MDQNRRAGLARLLIKILMQWFLTCYHSSVFFVLGCAALQQMCKILSPNSWPLDGSRCADRRISSLFSECRAKGLSQTTPVGRILRQGEVKAPCQVKAQEDREGGTSAFAPPDMSKERDAKWSCLPEQQRKEYVLGRTSLAAPGWLGSESQEGSLLRFQLACPCSHLSKSISWST